MRTSTKITVLIVLGVVVIFNLTRLLMQHEPGKEKRPHQQQIATTETKLVASQSKVALLQKQLEDNTRLLTETLTRLEAVNKASEKVVAYAKRLEFAALNGSPSNIESHTTPTSMRRTPQSRPAVEVYDRIGPLRERIRDTEVSLAIMKNNVNESSDPDIRVFRRAQIERFEDGLGQMQNELANLETEAQVAQR